MPGSPTDVCRLASLPSEETISLAHGEGGRLTHRLIAERIVPRFGDPELAKLGDAAALRLGEAKLAFTTDQFVVAPLFFPGGDIGRLAILGTSNDLAVAGAQARWLSLSLVIEEGLPQETLDRVLDSAAEAAREVGASVVAGDTKVVPRGAADGLFLGTSGIGEFRQPAPPGPAHIVPGDALLVSGPIGRHGVAVLAAREQLGFEPEPRSDLGNLLPACEALLRSGLPIRSMRDATRGGVAAVLQEWRRAGRCSFVLDEAAIPVSPDVRGVCELLGLDPLHVANEGTMVVAVEGRRAAEALSILRGLPRHAGAAVIGHSRADPSSSIVVRRILGREAPLDEPQGAPMPRIC